VLQSINFELSLLPLTQVFKEIVSGNDLVTCRKWHLTTSSGLRGKRGKYYSFVRTFYVKWILMNYYEDHSVDNYTKNSIMGLFAIIPLVCPGDFVRVTRPFCS
jgi:hypothetical protein